MGYGARDSGFGALGLRVRGLWTGVAGFRVRGSFRVQGCRVRG